MGDKDIEEDGCQADLPSLRSIDSGYNSKSLPVGASLDGSIAKQETSISQDMNNLNLEIQDEEQHSPHNTVKFSDRKSQGKRLSTSEIMEMYDGDEDGDNQLHISIIQCLWPISIYIIKHAPTRHWLDIPNKLLQTPLHLAVHMRCVDIVDYLLTKNADFESRDVNGDTPMHLACRKGFDEIVTMFVRKVRHGKLDLKNYNGQTCAHVAAEGTHLSILGILSSAGADMNAGDSKSGRTILHYAAESGNMTLASFVLQLPNVDVNKRNYAGKPPLALARGKGHVDIIRRLERSGAVPESSSSSSSSSSDSEG
ncbi:hypothetical protein FSP39_000627 [Pinctada imbricata]|uniref:Uncharacterized protein n=1 Tax=Pinctada imbricata TaxID=66713 RepID=A0AA88XY76_PINIB|nr:hypothetical protein FSP39_000627 [Pinctada imbricata]